MQVDMDDLIPASELTRSTALYVREAAAGRRIVILNNSVPRAALVSIEDLKILARQNNTSPTGSPGSNDFLTALGIDDPDSFDPRPTWAANDDPDTPLVVPIGTTAASVYQLDISRDHNGVIEGATGSGRAMFLDMLIVALCATYSPSRLKILLATGSIDRIHNRTLARLPQVTIYADESAPKRKTAEGAEPSYIEPLFGALQETMLGRPASGHGAPEPDVLVIYDDPIWDPLALGKRLPYWLEQGPKARVFTLLAVQSYEQLQALDERMGDQKYLGYQVALNDAAPPRPALPRLNQTSIETGEALVSTSFATELARLRRFSSAFGGTGDEPKMDLLHGLAARIAFCSEGR